jgi:hypothetical protein
MFERSTFQPNRLRRSLTSRNFGDTTILYGEIASRRTPMKMIVVAMRVILGTNAARGRAATRKMRTVGTDLLVHSLSS